MQISQKGREPKDIAKDMFNNLIFLKIKNNGFKWTDIYCLEILIKVAKNPGIRCDELTESFTHDTPDTILEFEISQVCKSADLLKSKDLLKIDLAGGLSTYSGKLNLTESGSVLYSFVSDNMLFERWISSVVAEGKESADADTVKKLYENVQKLREFLVMCFDRANELALKLQRRDKQ